MKHALLIYWDERTGAEAGAEHGLAVMRDCHEHNRKMAAAGVFLDGAPLELTSTAKTVGVAARIPVAETGSVEVRGVIDIEALVGQR